MYCWLFNLWDDIAPVRTVGFEIAKYMGCYSSACSCTCAFKLYVVFLSTICERKGLVGYERGKTQRMTCYGVIHSAMLHLAERFVMKPTPAS